MGLFAYDCAFTRKDNIADMKKPSLLMSCL